MQVCSGALSEQPLCANEGGSPGKGGACWTVMPMPGPTHPLWSFGTLQPLCHIAILLGGAQPLQSLMACANSWEGIRLWRSAFLTHRCSNKYWHQKETKWAPQHSPPEVRSRNPGVDKHNPCPHQVRKLRILLYEGKSNPTKQKFMSYTVFYTSYLDLSWSTTGSNWAQRVIKPLKVSKAAPKTPGSCSYSKFLNPTV